MKHPVYHIICHVIYHIIYHIIFHIPHHIIFYIIWDNIWTQFHKSGPILQGPITHLMGPVPNWTFPWMNTIFSPIWSQSHIFFWYLRLPSWSYQLCRCKRNSTSFRKSNFTLETLIWGTRPIINWLDFRLKHILISMYKNCFLTKKGLLPQHLRKK